MITLRQRYINYDGTEWSVTHIYSETGHFERDGKPAGWHIQLGTYDSVSNYTEVEDSSMHDVPASLPDIIIPEPEDEEEATAEDYETALQELGVNVHEEE